MSSAGSPWRDGCAVRPSPTAHPFRKPTDDQGDVLSGAQLSFPGEFAGGGNDSGQLEAVAVPTARAGKVFSSHVAAANAATRQAAVLQTSAGAVPHVISAGCLHRQQLMREHRDKMVIG